MKKSVKKKATVYSCWSDVNQSFTEFWMLAERAKAGIVTTRLDPRKDARGNLTGETAVEFRSSLDIEGLRGLVARFPDLRLMRQTLRACPLAENSLEPTPPPSVRVE
jgi:hypothetical protein